MAGVPSSSLFFIISQKRTFQNLLETHFNFYQKIFCRKKVTDVATWRIFRKIIGFLSKSEGNLADPVQNVTACSDPLRQLALELAQ